MEMYDKYVKWYTINMLNRILWDIIKIPKILIYNSVELGVTLHTELQYGT